MDCLGYQMIDIPQGKLDKIQPLDLPRFEKIRESEFRPPYNLFGLKYLRDKAGNERNLRELYKSRAPYELLQNADDAGARKAAFILSLEGLAFAHDGLWFTVDNFRSLADGWSDKDPNQCIGHKGLGFRSVLEITPAPQLLKMQRGEFFGVKFTWALNNGHIQETLRQHSELRVHYNNWTKQGQICCPIMAIPGLVKKQTLALSNGILESLVNEDYGKDFTTMFWFPSEDPDISQAVLTELSPEPIVADDAGRERLLDFIVKEVSVMLPFLASIREVRVYQKNVCLAYAQVPPETPAQKEGEIKVIVKTKDTQDIRSFFRMNFVNDIPPQIKNLPDTPKAVKRMDRARISLLIRLENGQPVPDDDSVFHVYFPTREPTGTGFIIHGDFYVKPDRTRLMESRYNEWLLESVANYVANEVLTKLLERYEASAVFETLAPVEHVVSDSASYFRQCFAKALQKRQEPFVPTNKGLLKRDEVILPPIIDTEGFWEKHFAEELEEVVEGKKAFLTPREDRLGTREFLSFASVDTLKSDRLLEFIEAASREAKDPRWWYACYSYLAKEENLSRHDHSYFVGRRLIPVGEGNVISVPEEDSVVVALPPTGSVAKFVVPKCFSHSFVFLDGGLAKLLQTGEDVIRSWVLDRFRISRFEATELLPRAIRRVAPQIFSGELSIVCSELVSAWIFMKRITDASRMIESLAFWEDVGRFPLPVQESSQDQELDRGRLSPAFLSYWPDSWIEGDNCLSQIEGLRRVDEKFLEELVDVSRTPRNGWQGYLSQVGVSAGPKLLKYSRIIGTDDELVCEVDAVDGFSTKGFRGERQSDMNSAVIEQLKAEQLWNHMVTSISPCSHDLPKVLQNMCLLEGLRPCVEMAAYEFESGDEHWRHRLWALIRRLPISSLSNVDLDAAYCRGGGGHSVNAGCYLERQLQHYSWLPSSVGPMNSADCFLRSSTRRFISSGTYGDELGDKLLPYVVVEHVDDLARLQNLGILILEDAESASIASLLRALALLGDELSTDLGREEILASPGRWRLVRGAIQETYRRLNQSQEAIEFPRNIKFASRSPRGARFVSAPLYYADPGSAVERAFMDVLPLFDADRPYPRLFEQIPVTRLETSGEHKTIEERLLVEGNYISAPALRDEIVNNLSQFMLAPIVAKSERQKDIDLIVRRLQERLDVKVANNLTVSFSLSRDPSVQRSVDFTKFYLQRQVVPGAGAIEEARYVLYVVGNEKSSIINLDADALGQTLAPIFFIDRVSEDIASVFSRIAYRYQQTNGNFDEMREFLFGQLGISHEAQDMARALVSGEDVDAREITVQLPPPAKVVTKSFTSKEEASGEQKGTLDDRIHGHGELLKKKAADFLQQLTTQALGTKQTAGAPTSQSTLSINVSSTSRITQEQEERGRRGEQEIKRRLQLPGGWMGFSLCEDKRQSGCGYDFLCDIDGRQVKLEVKTFSSDGYVIVTNRELQEAAASQDDYYLVGVLDDGKPENEWQTFMIRNPIRILLSEGEFDIQARLYARAGDLFEIDENS